jgi:hydroxymethylbilane synthase
MSKHPSPDCTRSFSSSKTFILGTRKSALALVQAKLVADALRALYPSPSYEFPIKSMSTVGDRNQTTPLHLLTASSPDHPAKSLWTEELETSLMTGGMDMIVHALKDVPTTLKGGCEIACILRGRIRGMRSSSDRGSSTANSRISRMGVWWALAV